VSQLLSVPFAAAALVLCVAGAAKLRSPAGAARAITTLGLPGSRPLVRGFGALEIVLGAWCLAAPGPIPAGVATSTFAAFAVVSRALVSRRASCGCFGDGDLPASAAHVVLSALLGALCAASALGAPRSLEWMLGRPPGLAGALVIAAGGCAYAIVLAYTLLPPAWSAWSAST
jgi:hypothetical protein